LLIIKAEDVLNAQLNAKNDQVKEIQLTGIPHLSVKNSSFGVSPSLLSISIGEEFLALDTQRNGVPFVLIFKLDQFLLQARKST